MTGQPLVIASKLDKYYGKNHVLKSLDIDLMPGETMGLLGHNGAGKTTFMKIILGVAEKTSGHIQVLGGAPGENKNQIGYVPENVQFYPALTGLETLVYFAKLKKLKQPKEQALRLLESLGLGVAKDRPVQTYSKGMNQKLGLAQALLGAPKLLILDEPTVGLDPIATEQFYQSLKQLKSGGTSIILCTHVLAGLESLLDQVLILNQGQILAQGNINELRQQAQLPTQILPAGLNASLSQDPELAPYLNQDGYLMVPESENNRVINLLLDKPGLINLQVDQPGLPALYRYFQQAKS